MYRGVNIIPAHFHDRGGDVGEVEGFGCNVARLLINQNPWTSIEAGIAGALRIISESKDLRFIIGLSLDCRCDYARHLLWWQRIVPLFDHLEQVIGYDIVNEPLDDDTNMRGWKGALPVFFQAMRAMTGKVLLVEPGPGPADGAFATIPPFGDDRVWFGCHIYNPHAFTHQGIDGREAGKVWPGQYDHGGSVPRGPVRDIGYIKMHLQRLMDWEDAWGRPIFIGEIGIAADAEEESATRYIDDVVGLCEERGWSWCWHDYPGVWFPVRDRLKHYWALNSQTHAHE